MRPIQLVILLVAFGAAGAAGMIAMNLSKRPAAVKQEIANTPAIETVEVLVASADVNMGTAITSDKMTWKMWPSEGLSSEFITRTQRADAISELQGTLVRSPIMSGEPIREAKLVRSDRGFLSAVMPKGMRAVAVKVNAATAAGGFILPNDRVDVIVIITSRSSSGAASSETLLTNVRVLAIDQTVQTQNTDQAAVVVAQDTVTLEVTPEQAELVAQAQQVGTISLSLRSIEDMAIGPGEVEKPTGISVVKFGLPSRVTARAAQ